jgi:hypothetical protein
MLRNLYYAPHFHEPHPHTQPAGQSLSFWSPLPMIIALSATWSAFREGLAAHREYERLRSSGTSHDKALRGALGFGQRPSGHVRSGAPPLYCAGRA